ncbi:MAG: homoserine kinase [Blastocatellia bacterium]|jgi:homoserine kinase
MLERSHMTTTEITVPASTSNLGASFDTCGLALSLYLRIEVTPAENGIRIDPFGEGAEKVPRDESNLVVRAALYAAEQRKRTLPGAHLRIESEIPLSRGLGSSSSAIIAGLSVYEVLTGDQLTEQDFFDYALHFEGHGDNLAPSALGGLVVAVVREEIDYAGNERRSLLAVKRHWPEEIRIIVCIPELEMETARMRSVLPRMVTRPDAIYNLQRGALFQAAISERRFDLIHEAMRDRLHQPYRAPLAPGLRDVLQLHDEVDAHPGLLGVAISGAGSTLIALTLGDGEALGREMVARLAACGVSAVARELTVDQQGRTIRPLSTSDTADNPTDETLCHP